MDQSHILIADDEEMIRTVLKRAIEEQRPGCRVAAAADGPAALALLQRQPCDLVILDFMMPDMNGLDLAWAIRRRWPRTRIVLMTGHGAAFLGNMADLLDLDGYLQKPFKVEELLATVDRMLEPGGLVWQRERRSG